MTLSLKPASLLDLSYYFIGIYVSSIDKYQNVFTFDREQVSFNGCNINSASYNANTKQAINITKLPTIGQNVCLNNSDDLYSSILSNTVTYQHDLVNDIIVFKDLNDQSIAVFVRPLILGKKIPIGQYSVKSIYVPNGEATVIVSVNSILIKGNCFNQKADYMI
jgi:hypothetical protein